VHRHLTLLIDQIVRRGQALDALKKGFGGHRILEGQILVQSGRVKLLLHIRVEQNRFDLRAVHQTTVIQQGVVHRLDAEIVPRDEQRLLRHIPDGKAEHTPQTGQQIGTPLLVAVDQGLAVALGGKGVTQLDQLGPQSLIVIDLAVKHQHQGLVLVIQRLRGPLHVNDAQTAKAHMDAGIHIITVRVRAPMGDGLGHLTQIPLSVHNLAGKAAKSAHTILSFR